MLRLYRTSWINQVMLMLSILASLSEAKYKDPEDHAKTGFACEDATLKVSCPAGRTIRILRANYGRFSMRPCIDEGTKTDTNKWNLQCMSLRSLSIVNEMCTGKSDCNIVPSNRIFGDPCPLTPKYLEVQWKCVKTSNKPERTRPPNPIRPTSTTMSSTSTTESATSSATTASTSTVSSTESSTAFTTTEEIVEGGDFCEDRQIRNVSWPRTLPGKRRTRPCPNNPNAQADWHCGLDPVEWIGLPDLSQCVSLNIARLNRRLLATQEELSNKIIEEVAADMIAVSQNEVYGGDLDAVSNLMHTMIEQIDTRVHEVHTEKNENLVKNVNKAVVKSTSNLLDGNKKDAWKDLPQKTQAKTATRLMNSVEKSGSQLADLYDEPIAKMEVDINIVLQINVINTRESSEEVCFPNKQEIAAQNTGDDWAESGDSITLSAATIREHGVEGLAKLIFATYRNLEEFLVPQSDQPKRNGKNDDEKDQEISNVIHGSDGGIEYSVDSEKAAEEEEENTNNIVNTNVISASINARKEATELAEPVYYTLEHKNIDNIYNPTCSFWEYEEKTMTGHWSRFGCKLVQTNTTHSTCACNHMTNFAVLMNVEGTELASHHEMGLQIITYFGCIISIVCLLICIFTFTFFKHLHCDRNTIHRNLCICLFLAQVIFVTGIMQYDKEVLCSIVAGLLHYFLLAAFMWMFLEGLQLYIMLVEVFEAEKSRRVYYYLTGYGVPAIIVIISASVYHQGYGTDSYCWLTPEKGFIWAFVGPVIAVISVNIVMLSIAIYKMCEHAKNVSSWKMKQRSRFESIRSWMKGATVLVVLLGLTWTFGLLYINDHAASVFWAYVFTLLNSLQGLFIFIFHCLLNDKVQKEYKKIARRTTWLPDCIRVNYGGSKTSTVTVSSTPNSSSSGNVVQRMWSKRFRKRSSTTSILNKSTSAQAKWNADHSRSSGLRSPDSGLYSGQQDSSHVYSEPTEDPGGYLEPISLRNAGKSFDFEDIHGEPMSTIEGSCVESDFLLNYCNKSAEPEKKILDVDKYKIQTPPTERSKLALMATEETINESDEYTDNSEDEKEYKRFLAKAHGEELSEDDTLKLKRELKRLSSSDSGNVDVSSSLNDLNKDNSDEEMNLSKPNIDCRPATLKPDNQNIEKLKNAGILRSLPDLSIAMIDKPPEGELKYKKPWSKSDDGLMLLN